MAYYPLDPPIAPSLDMKLHERVALQYLRAHRSPYGAQFVKNTRTGKLWRAPVGPGFRYFVTSDDVSGNVLVFPADSNGKITSDVEFSTGRTHEDAADNGAKWMGVTHGR